jgi:ribosomal biogenesis protein LAS1
MDSPRTRFVVTPWRDGKELLQLRRDLYASNATRREAAVNKVWSFASAAALERKLGCR